MKNKRAALITGVTSQDGFYLAEFYYKKGHEVHGVKRRCEYRTPMVSLRTLLVLTPRISLRLIQR